MHGGAWWCVAVRGAGCSLRSGCLMLLKLSCGGFPRTFTLTDAVIKMTSWNLTGFQMSCCLQQDVCVCVYVSLNARVALGHFVFFVFVFMKRRSTIWSYSEVSVCVRARARACIIEDKVVTLRVG